jgi:hypothetical protein
MVITMVTDLKACATADYNTILDKAHFLSLFAQDENVWEADIRRDSGVTGFPVCLVAFGLLCKIPSSLCTHHRKCQKMP